MPGYGSRATLRITGAHYRKLEALVELEEFPSVSEAIRTAIDEMIKDRAEKLKARSKLLEYIKKD